jgi:hypothetical protein
MVDVNQQMQHMFNVHVLIIMMDPIVNIVSCILSISSIIDEIIVKPIEYAARFDGKAFIVFSADEFPHLTSEKEESVELRFKTNALFGVNIHLHPYS